MKLSDLSNLSNFKQSLQKMLSAKLAMPYTDKTKNEGSIPTEATETNLNNKQNSETSGTKKKRRKKSEARKRKEKIKKKIKARQKKAEKRREEMIKNGETFGYEDTTPEVTNENDNEDDYLSQKSLWFSKKGQNVSYKVKG